MGTTDWHLLNAGYDVSVITNWCSTLKSLLVFTTALCKTLAQFTQLINGNMQNWTQVFLISKTMLRAIDDTALISHPLEGAKFMIQ